MTGTNGPAPAPDITATESIVVQASAHGRILVRPPAGDARGILLGFHGYGQNAADCLPELESIPGIDGWALVAVDGLHAFYDRRNEKVLRSWMTRELRAEAIEDNVGYVRSILEIVRARFGWRLPVVALGFSQGASTAWRASVLAGHEIAAVVALAGDVPPELAELPAETRFPPLALLARGAGDEWYTAATLAADERLLAARTTRVERLVFAGGHEWTDEFRQAVSSLVSRIGASWEKMTP